MPHAVGVGGRASQVGSACKGYMGRADRMRQRLPELMAGDGCLVIGVGAAWCSSDMDGWNSMSGAAISAILPSGATIDCGIVCGKNPDIVYNMRMVLYYTIPVCTLYE